MKNLRSKFKKYKSNSITRFKYTVHISVWIAIAISMYIIRPMSMMKEYTDEKMNVKYKIDNLRVFLGSIAVSLIVIGFWEIRKRFFNE